VDDDDDTGIWRLRGEMKTALAGAIRNYMVERSLLPETRFRIPALGFLIGAGCAAIYVAGHHYPGPRSVWFARMQDLTVYLGIAFAIMVLFYLEHYLVRRLTTCKLEDRLGYRQSVWSSLLLLAGAIGILHPFDIAGFPDRMLIAAAIFGEIVFVWNVIRAFTRDEVVAIFPSSPSRRRVERGGDNFGWPKSPVMQFGIAAAGFAVGGFVSIVANTPSFEIPVPLGGQMRLVRFGWLALTAAIPFALYAGLYRWMIDNYRIHFDDSLNRVHFAVTIVGVILVIMEWEQSVMFRDTALPAPEQLGAIAGLGAIVFVINVYRGLGRRPATRRGNSSRR